MDSEVPRQFQKLSYRDMDDGSISSKRPRFYKRSLTMEQAMGHNHILERPTPLALKVNDAGKNFLRHDQTCQWIKFMHDPNPDPPRNTRSFGVVKQVSNCSLCMPDKVVSGPLVLQDSVTSYYDEQLKSLHKKQEELLERQHQLEEQLEEQHKVKETYSMTQLQDKGDVAEPEDGGEAPVITKAVQHVQISKGISPPFRRRLKGRIAEFCAERNEGTMKNLLFYMSRPETLEEMDHPVRPIERPYINEPIFVQGQVVDTKEISPARQLRGPHYSSPALLGRKNAKSQESGLAVSQLLFHDLRPPYLELLKSVTDSSVKEVTLTASSSKSS